MEGWNTMWLGTLNITPFIETPKPQESIVFHNKLILIKNIFQDINRQMLEISYTLNLGQLLKMVHELKIYLWQKIKLDKK
jgi:hypothetical protein